MGGGGGVGSKGSEGLGSPYVFPAFSVHTVDDLNS